MGEGEALFFLLFALGAFLLWRQDMGQRADEEDERWLHGGKEPLMPCPCERHTRMRAELERARANPSRPPSSVDPRSTGFMGIAGLK